MQACILGPVQIRSDAGAVLAPSGGKQRLLLALLLVHAPRVVSPDRLMDVLWEDRRPDDPSAALRTQLSRLRGFLAGAGADGRLRRGAAGHGLALEPDEIDAAVFEDLQSRARAAESPERGLALAEAALALWRDEPFGEFHGLPDFIGETLRLRELALGARERRVECLLALGRTHDALASSEALVHADPLRERSRALAMQAFYQAGRQHEALASFQDYRRRLSEELGLEPSPGLCALQLDILQHARPSRADRAPVVVAVPSTESPATSEAMRLPVPITPMIGRVQQEAALHRLLGALRLLTLTGAGGSGKTRLALEVAHRIRQDGGRDVVWVGLDAISDSDAVRQAVAAACGLRERPDHAAIDDMGQLATRTLLLVLDNCEHLVDACARLAEELLRTCPGVAILATSREPLGITGETTWPIPPLSLPEDGEGDPRELEPCEAVQLFVARARANLPTFALTQENGPAVGRICRQLDGLPLALELAAARVRVLTPQEITQRLEADLDVLCGGSRPARARHQTLRAAIDWSCRLLSDQERCLYQRLSVFGGGFSLAAVEAVCADGATLTADAVLPVLSALVDKSLVVARPEAGTMRYHMLSTVRSHAREQLAQSGSLATVCDRHAEFFADLAEQAEPHLFGGAGAPAWIARIDVEDQNLHDAAAWCLGDERRCATALRLLSALHWYWFARGRFREGRRLLAAAVQQAGTAPQALRAKALTALGIVGVWQGEADAVRPLLAESVAILRPEGDRRALAYALACLGAATLGSDPRAACRLCEQAAVTVRTEPSSPLSAFVCFWHGLTSLAVDDAGTAGAAFEEAVGIGRALRNKPCIAHPLTMLGRLHSVRGHHEVALDCLVESLAIHRDLADLFGAILAIEGVAAVAAARDDATDALRLFAAADSLRATIGGPLLPFEEARYARTIRELESRLRPGPDGDARDEGRRMTFEAAAEAAVACAGRVAAD